MALGNWTKGQTVSISYGEYDSHFSGTFEVLVDVNLDEFLLEVAKVDGDFGVGIERKLIDAGIICWTPVSGSLDLGYSGDISKATTNTGGIDRSAVTEAVYGDNGKVSTWGDLLDLLDR